MSFAISREGTWTIELVRPLTKGDQPIGSITLQPISADHMIRWEDERIPSFYALMAEISGVPERILLNLSGVDLERVMFAFQTILTMTIRQDFEAKKRPLSTVYDSVPHPQDVEAPALPGAPPRDPMVEPFPPDPVDPRYPNIGGPVVQRPPNEPPRRRPMPVPDPGSGMNLSPPDAMERVG